jgi:hypothetical protein
MLEQPPPRSLRRRGCFWPCVGAIEAGAGHDRITAWRTGPPAGPRMTNNPAERVVTRMSPGISSRNSRLPSQEGHHVVRNGLGGGGETV